MKEIGGYIEFEHYSGTLLHENAIALNSGRYALEYLIRAKKIKKICIPYFMCDSCEDVLKRNNVEVHHYYIGKDFLPNGIECEPDQWIYIVNYYGQLNNVVIEQLKLKYYRIIVDNAQSYFQYPVNDVDTLYTCRKFFGVSDGAFLYTDCLLNEELQLDKSYSRMNFLLGRFENTANEFYDEYVENNSLFDSESIKQMSSLTKNILRSLDYDKIKKIRKENFLFLHKKLADINGINLHIPEGPFMYPLYVENGTEIRRKLQAIHIYIPTLWPNVLDQCPEDTIEYQYAKNILPLPVDQRYTIYDMEYVFEKLMEVLEFPL